VPRTLRCTWHLYATEKWDIPSVRFSSLGCNQIFSCFWEVMILWELSDPVDDGATCPAPGTFGEALHPQDCLWQLEEYVRRTMLGNRVPGFLYLAPSSGSTIITVYRLPLFSHYISRFLPTGLYIISSSDSPYRYNECNACVISCVM